MIIIYMAVYDGNSAILHNSSAVMQDEPVLTIHIDYPLTHPYVHTATRSDGLPWTVADFASEVQKAYRHIYTTEENAVGNPGHILGTMNREVSFGPFGIWGHDLEDLILDGANKMESGAWTLCVTS